MLSGILGLYTGWQLSDFNNFQFYKLLNITGLLYDFFAVILISYVVLAQDKIKEFIVTHVARFFIIFTMIFPNSMLLAAMIRQPTGTIAGSEVTAYVLTFIAISALPMNYVFRSPVYEPTYNKSYPPDKRLKLLGTVILLVGFSFQIIASFNDLMQGA